MPACCAPPPPTWRAGCSEVRADNAKGEYYLTDVVALARVDGGASPRWRRRPKSWPASTRAPNSPPPRPSCSRRLRAAAMDAGVTMIDPGSVFLCADTELAPDVDDRTQRHVRSRREGRIRCADPRLQSPGRLHHRPGLHRRPARPAAPRRGTWRGGARRQLRRGEGSEARRARQGEPPDAISATRTSARTPTSAPAPSPATTMATTSIAPLSARARSSARTPHWWRR